MLAVVAVIAWTWWSAPARGVDHVPAAAPFEPVKAAAEIPGAVEEAWRHPAPLSGSPFTVEGLVLAAEDNGVAALDPETGEEVWSYRRDVPLCAAMASFERVITVFRGPAGCGEVTALEARDGTYAGTRRSIGSDEVVPVRSNDRAGMRHPGMVELWRNDMVRTVEYGYIKESPEPGLQPHPGCRVADAMTRLNLLAVVNSCPDGHRLVLQRATPEESRSPEVDADVELPSSARLVAIGKDRAAVLMDGEIVVYDEEGRRSPGYRPEGAVLPEVPDTSVFPLAETADLPHHMTWFTGSELIAFRPDDLSVAFTVPGALGTGTLVDGTLLVPVEGGILQVDGTTGEPGPLIPVDRAGDAGAPVTLTSAGAFLVEKRGDDMVGLRAPR